MVTRRVLILPALAAVVLSACGSPEDSGASISTVESSITIAETTTAPETTTTVPETTTTVPETTTTMVEATTTTGGTVPDVPSSNPNNAPEQVLAKALLDLQSRLNVDPVDVTVVLSEQKTWNDGSIGCPQPGIVYTQAQVDGARVLLEVDGRLYAYHAGADGEPFLCESNDKDGGYDFVPPPGYDE